MIILRKTVSFLLILAFCIGVFCSCEADNKQPDIESLPILPSEPVKYSESFSKLQAKRLYAAADIKIREIYGNKLPASISLLESCFEKAFIRLETRGVSEEKAKAFSDTVYSNNELFEEFITSAKDKKSLPISASVKLFGELAELIGINTTSLFIYDILDIFCEYMEDKAMMLYRSNPAFTYLLDEAEEWKQKRRSVSDIGEESFSYLTRAAISISAVESILSGEGDDLSLTLSGTELSIFLKTEGEMISKISLSRDDIKFILTELGESDILFFKAISKSGDVERMTQSFKDLQHLVVKLLVSFDEEECDLLLSGNTSAALYKATRIFNYKDLEKITNILSGENEEEYKQYFTNKKLLSDYLKFKEGIKTTTMDELKVANENDFIPVLKNYISTLSPALSFTVLRNDKSQQS